VSVEELQEHLARAEAMVRLLQQELVETNRGVMAITLELEQRVDQRDTELRLATSALEQSNARLTSTQATVRDLQEELNQTNRGLVALTLELEQRVDQRTAELRQLNLELEARVQERTAQLREANLSLQHFAYTAAHDPRSPLRLIKSFSAIVLEDNAAQLGKDAQECLQRISRSATQMRQLLDDLLEYSRLAEKELRLQEVSLERAVGEALALLEEDIRTRNAAITVEDALPTIIGHPATVVLLINNLVSNALKFTSPGVPPQVRIWAERRAHVGAAERPEFDRVRLWVRDNGIGIHSDNVEKVFEAFQRLHSKSDYPGTGLGLAIVRKGAERMGGHVGVESQPGKGSQFWIELNAVRLEGVSPILEQGCRP
jgi:signal transduction histidine kinase